jgi:hypothetical protein
MPNPIDHIYAFDHGWFYEDQHGRLRGDPDNNFQGFATQEEALRAMRAEPAHERLSGHAQPSDDPFNPA